MRRLIIRPGAIGDLIVSLPALQSVCTSDAEIWVAEQNVPLVQIGCPVRSIGSTGINLVGIGDLRPPVLEALRDFDSILSWYGTSQPEFRSAVSHLPFKFFPALPTTAGMHACDFYLSQVGAPLGQLPRIHAGKGGKKQGYVAVHPFSGSPRKNWALDKFRLVAQAIPRPVEFIAGPEETLSEARRFAQLDELADYLAGADLYIGNDSGVSHLAVAVGTPAVVLFRVTDPTMWAPRGTAPVAILEGDPDPGLVLQAAVELLSRHG